MDKENDLAEKIFMMFVEKFSKDVNVKELDLWSEFFDEDEDKDLMVYNMVKAAKELANIFYKN